MTSAWDITDGTKSVRDFIQSVAHRLTINMSDFSPNDQLVYHYIGAWFDATKQWPTIRNIPTKRDEIVGGVKILVEYLKEPA